MDRVESTSSWNTVGLLKYKLKLTRRGARTSFGGYEGYIFGSSGMSCEQMKGNCLPEVVDILAKLIPVQVDLNAVVLCDITWRNRQTHGSVYI